MIHSPQFKPHLRVDVIKGEGVFVSSDLGHSVLTGRVFESVASLIDGVRSTEDVVAALQPEISAAEAYYAVAMLEQQGYLMESTPPAPTHGAVFWSLQGLSQES